MHRYPLNILVMLATLIICVSNSFAVPLIGSEIRDGVAVIQVAQSINIDLPEGGAFRSGDSDIDRSLDAIGASKIEPKFFGCFPPVKGGADLTRFYNVYFDESADVRQVCRVLEKGFGILDASPWEVQKCFMQYNDPQRGRQPMISLLDLASAHDIATGSKATAVAIVDTGVLLTHEDLAANIWINPGEDLNGNGVVDDNERNNRDDDGDGRRDDFYGWNFVNNNNNPGQVNAGQDYHGTHCAGDASAVTNNGRGIVSPGYSCGIMAVRSGAGMSIQYGYEGIQYAVRAGAKVISCSWGGPGNSPAGEAVINYARDHDVLVVVAAGNDNSDNESYPAAYEAALAVAATNANDVRAGFSNYGNWVDICAPGVNIWSTISASNTSYEYLDGTSMACPIVAGCAVLFRSAYPAATAAMTRQALLDGAENIDNVNRAYQGRLGSGRVNLFASLQLGNRPVLTIDTLIVEGDANGNGRIDPGEEATFSVQVSNDIRAQDASGVIVQVYSDDASLSFPVSQVNMPDIPAGQAVANVDTPFVVQAQQIPAHTAYITAEVTTIEGENLAAQRTFEVVIGHPDVLIVDDDDSSDVETWYYGVIENASHGWARWDVAKQYSPDAVTLEDYNMVIWMTGNTEWPLDDLDRFQIETAVNEGAHIMLIGNRIGDDMFNQDLLQNQFGAVHEADSVNVSTVEGISNDRPIVRNSAMSLIGEGAYDEQRYSPSTMRPVLGADSLCLYKYGGPQVTGLAGVYREDDRTHSRTIYLGFNFEEVSNTRTPPSAVLGRLYDWFVGNLNGVPEWDGSSPIAFKMLPAFPNPFNSQVRIGFELDRNIPYSVGIYDAQGRQVRLLSEGVGSPGSHSLLWNASGVGAGTYIVKLQKASGEQATQQLLLVK